MFLRLYLDNGNNIQICEARKSIQQRMDENVLYPWYGITNREMELKFDDEGNPQYIKYLDEKYSKKYPNHEGKIINWELEYSKKEDKNVLYKFLSKKISNKKQLQEIKRKIYN